MEKTSFPKSPMISVVMACYNGDRWLAQAIESILSQSFTDFELILVDDGSKDKTPRILEEYSHKDSRIVLIQKANTGLADSLNVGLGQAKGEWIARLDQDDVAEPERLRKQLEFVNANPEVILLGTGFLEIDADECVIKHNYYPVTHLRLLHNLERLKRFFPHSSAFYRADIAREVGGYNRRFHRAEDRGLWLKLALNGKIACLGECLVRIRKHPMQMSLDDKGARQFFDAIAATSCYFLNRAGKDDPATKSNNEEWEIFLEWLEKRVVESGALARQDIWVAAREAYFSADKCFFGGIKAIRLLVKSGHIGTIFWEKLFGSGLPKKIAAEWAPSHKLLAK